MSTPEEPRRTGEHRAASCRAVPSCAVFFVVTKERLRRVTRERKIVPFVPILYPSFALGCSLSPSRFLLGVFYYIVVARARLPPSSVVTRTFRRYRLRYRVSVPVKSKTLERVIFRPHSKSLIFRFSLSHRSSRSPFSPLEFQRRKPSTTRSIITSAKTLGSVNYFTSFLAHILSNISPPSSLSYTHTHTYTPRTGNYHT